jgi:hypothetical protein
MLAEIADLLDDHSPQADLRVASADREEAR